MSKHQGWQGIDVHTLTPREFMANITSKNSKIAITWYETSDDQYVNKLADSMISAAIVIEYVYLA
jgi:hypothetical protein